MVQSAKGGHAETTNGLCILYQNVINDKIFFLLWWWMAFLSWLGFLQLVFDIALLFFPWGRKQLIIRAISPKPDPSKDSAMISFLTWPNLDLGEWFFLYQISKNVDSIFFGALVEKVANQKMAGDIEGSNEPLVDFVDEKRESQVNIMPTEGAYPMLPMDDGKYTKTPIV